MVGTVVAITEIEFAGLEQTSHGRAFANFPLADLNAAGLEVGEAQLDVKAHGLLLKMLVAPVGPFNASDHFPDGAVEDMNELGGNRSDFLESGGLAGEAFCKEAAQDGLENFGGKYVLSVGKSRDGDRCLAV